MPVTYPRWRHRETAGGMGGFGDLLRVDGETICWSGSR